MTFYPLLTYFEFRKCRSVGEIDESGREGEIDTIPLFYEGNSVPPHLAGLLQGLPERWRWVAPNTGQEPDLKENTENTFAQLITNVVLDRRRGQEDLIDGQEEEQEGLPGFSSENLRHCGVLESSEDAMAENCLPIDGVSS